LQRTVLAVPDAANALQPGRGLLAVAGAPGAGTRGTQETDMTITTATLDEAELEALVGRAVADFGAVLHTALPSSATASASTGPSPTGR
jgi:hypothetical protein